MLESLQIRNFRVFKALEINPLSHVNLIAGRNNSGKTSFLEALFLLVGAGNPRMAINAHVIRGLQLNVPLQEMASDNLWDQLFHDMNNEKLIEIAGHHTSYGHLVLEIELKDQPITGLSSNRKIGFSMTSPIGDHRLVIRFSGFGNPSVESHIHVKGQEVEIKQPNMQVPYIGIILLSRLRNDRDDAERLETLRRQKRAKLVVEALRIIEPRLQSVEVYSSGGSRVIYGDVGLSEMVPMPVMGEGMTQIARIVLAISSAPDGVVLVDEIENGIHHSVLSDLWRVVDDAAERFNAQLFATTHSLECVTAAHEALGPDRFRLHRLEVADATNRCVTYESDSIRAAIRHGFEVR